GDRESGRSPKRARGVAKVLPQDIEVHAARVGGDIKRRRDDQDDRRPPAGIVPLAREVLAHLAAVFGAERFWKEVQQRAVETHYAFLVTNPLARAIRTSSARRLASSRATARPCLVIR